MFSCVEDMVGVLRLCTAVDTSVSTNFTELMTVVGSYCVACRTHNQNSVQVVFFHCVVRLYLLSFGRAQEIDRAVDQTTGNITLSALFC